MSTIKIWEWRRAVQKAPIKPITKLVLYTLSNYMNEDGGSCFPNQEELAIGCGLDLRSISRHIKEASDAGYIIIRKLHIKGNKWVSNSYQSTTPQSTTPQSTTPENKVTRLPSRINTTGNTSLINKKEGLENLCKTDLEVWILQMEMKGNPITINVALEIEKMKSHYLAYDGLDKNGNQVHDWKSKAQSWLISAQASSKQNIKQSFSKQKPRSQYDVDTRQ